MSLPLRVTSLDGSPGDTILGSQPSGVPGYALINLIPINLQGFAFLCHLVLSLRAEPNVTGMIQLLVYVTGANGFLL